QAQQSAYGRQPGAPAGTAGYQGANAAAGAQPAAATNASHLKQDPAASYLGQHHHHPGMGHDAMGSPYGSYMPNPASQLGSFGMGPIASLPSDYAALYGGNELQRAMYYDPSSYSQVPGAGANSYQPRDGKYSQESSSTVTTSGASSTGTSQAQQTLQQQQQQQQQTYPGMAGGIPYYPYYYMPNQFPNAYQQSGYGQPFMNKNMYPMYQQQPHSNKPGTTSNTPYGNYGTTGVGQGGHHQYSQSGYDDLSGLHGMGALGNEAYGKYNANPGMQGFLGGQQQQTGASTPNTGSGAKGGSGASTGYAAGTDKGATGAGSQSTNAAGGPGSLQGQQPGMMGQAHQGYYQQQMFSNYQYHQGYHPNQHQAGGRNPQQQQQQQFWPSQN
ncbi:hypothetical protein BGW38_004662, partial [Lunasporangiospora selenospora]